MKNLELEEINIKIGKLRINRSKFIRKTVTYTLVGLAGIQFLIGAGAIIYFAGLLAVTLTAGHNIENARICHLEINELQREKKFLQLKKKKELRLIKKIV